MTDTTTHLDNLIVDLEAEADALVAQFETEHAAALDRVRLARELRATFADPPPTPEPAARPARQVGCPDCGQLFPNRHAVDTHRRDEHPRSAAKPAAKAPRRPTTEAVRAVAAERVNCPDCGQTVSKMGLGTHRRIRHGYSKPSKPAATSTARPEPKLPENTTPVEWDLPERTSIDHEATTVYRCSDCGDERATVEGLGEHTYAHHQRPTRITEQAAVAPRPAAA